MSVKVIEQAQMKAATTEVGQRTLDFYALSFSGPDLNGDVIDKHALDAWLDNFYKAGKPLPLSFAHSAIRDDLDPNRFIGYAPADPDHVWIDSYGLRVKGLLNTDADGPMGENARAVARLVEQNVLGGASITYQVENAKAQEGSRLITKMELFEAGPCLMPMNPDAVLLGIKSADGTVIFAEKQASPESVDATVQMILAAPDVEALETKAVDESAWDGDRAMAACNSASDYDQICAGKRDGDPELRSSHALPHHYLGQGPNAAGVRAALAALGGARGGVQGLTNREEAQSHLNGHMRQINPGSESSSKTERLLVETVTEPIPDIVEDVLTELKHSSAPNHVQTAHDTLVRAGAKCRTAEVAAKSDLEHLAEEEPEPEWVKRARRLRLQLHSIT